MVDAGKSVTSYLRSQPFIATKVTEHERPVEGNCITAVLNGGANSQFYFGFPKKYIQPMVTIYIRNITYSGAMADAKSVEYAMRNYADLDAGIDGARMLGNLSDLGTDDQGRTELMFMYNILAKE